MEGVAKDKYGKIRKPFAQRFSGVTTTNQTGFYQAPPRDELRPRGVFTSFDNFRQVGTTPAVPAAQPIRAEPVSAYSAGLPPNWDAEIALLFYP